MKRLLVTLTLLSLLLSACSKVQNITYDLPPEQVELYETMLAENLDKLDEEGISEGDYNEALKNIAVSYERLGETQKAIDYFEQLLERHETNYTALNNLMAIYSELKDWDNAMKYAERYFNAYGRDAAVADKTIRVYVEAGEYDLAQSMLEFYVVNFSSDEDAQFISDTYDYIRRVRQKNEGSSEDVSVETDEMTE